ncbi:MAG: hypothetical protein ACOCX5_03465 [Chloroflexota bacterium]
MRRIIIFAILAGLLAALFRLNRLAADWHYVVPAQAGEVLYATTFDGTMGDWEQDARSLFAHEVVDGVLRITANDDATGPYSAASPYFSSFDVAVTTQTINGDFAGGNNNAFGIIFRQQDRANYYVFLVSGDGYYRVRRVVDNSYQDLSAWTRSDRINQGLGAENRLRVVGHEDRFRFFINGQLVQVCVPYNPEAISTVVGGQCRDGEWRDVLQDAQHTYGRIAMAVDADRARDTEIVVEFDDVIIYGASEITVQDP